MNTTDIDATRLQDISAFDGSLAHKVYLALQEAILSLQFLPGQVIRKGPVCEKLGVSRSPVSEAIARLANEGLVDVIPQSGTRVAYFSMEDIREGTFLRQALELASVAKVAEDRSEDQFAQINRNLRLQTLLVEDLDYSGFYQADEEFHALLMLFTGYPRLKTVARMVSLQVTRARMLLLPTPGRATETLDEHQAVVDAIRARDADAAQRAMRHHLGQLMPRIEALAETRPELFQSR
ncbi:GntR family transcriptional regulator [Roseibium album]|uniref:Putative HTH-type transcriptional regulator YdfH n=1 Tax=Roseibium album TaxID=311410 RepID=A0A0M7A7S8_9HYPH|nr:GntR family transcriptional regulator [Roseibium album]MBG6165343.1 DNA-binding GntR family transcriptional regulator [Labrenzia sp. EL_195]CTQ57767.1 putative HTH-type transcriptional regulator YdfH [Roseibium album]CTQ68371.1 putative HTH-type transcriptional regulator YdfH [Roseibium album]CTQ70671.1 putative HTH-type transcriptional regulator YdfH [Roseibium album]